MSAEILAIGPFSESIADALSYPAHYYEHTQAGTTVLTTLFSYLPGSSSSREFAGLLGISDPWDFNQHRIDPSRVELDALKRYFATLQDGEQYVEELTQFARLRDAGFEFYFLPNG